MALWQVFMIHWYFRFGIMMRFKRLVLQIPDARELFMAESYSCLILRSRVPVHPPAPLMSALFHFIQLPPLLFPKEKDLLSRLISSDLLPTSFIFLLPVE